MRKITILLLLISYSFSFAQENYKYVIIPKKFTIFNEENKYNTNFLTKSFFEKEGFEVFYDSDDFPQELAVNRCLALYADAVDAKSLFLTKVSIEIKDCTNKVVFTSQIGSTKEKQYDKAYPIVFREALSSLKGKLNFKTLNVANAAPKFESKATVVVNEKRNETSLYAIPIQNGFKLVDAVPNVIFELLATSMENVYSAKKGNAIGTFLKKNNEWYFEYYQNEMLVSEKVNVKF